MARHFISLFLLFNVAFLVGCDDEIVTAFIMEMSSLVEVDVPANLDDPCLMANAHAAAYWYRQLPDKYRNIVKKNIERYIQAVHFEPTQIMTNVPVAMARTVINYQQGVLHVIPTGVRNNGHVVCAPDIDVLREFTIEPKLLVSNRP